jgi:hypothetical protein
MNRGNQIRLLVYGGLGAAAVAAALFFSADLRLSVLNEGKNISSAITEQVVSESASGKAEKPDDVSGEAGETDEPVGVAKTQTDGKPLLILKDVGEPYLDHFGLSSSDYRAIKASGTDIIGVNFDICASESDVLSLLEGAEDAGLTVIMPAGSGEAEWGYPCDGEFADTLKPKWQKERVQEWVKKWAYHPAIFAWDISNEAGQNFPNAQRREDTWTQEGYALTLPQLQEAYADVKAADPTRPILARMNGWFFYDYDSNFFRTGNPYGKGVADIVMVNAYSNVEEFFDDMVRTVANRTQTAVHSMNPNAKIIVAVGAWKESPMWYLPSVEHFNNDVLAAQSINDLLGVAVFKYGAEQSEWWMPRDAKELWSVLFSF